MTGNVRSSVCEEADERLWPRMPVAVPASIAFAGQNFTARLANIAPGGAMLETEAEPDVGATAIFQCGTISAQATVIWRNPGKIGLSFIAPLTGSQVDEQISRGEALAARRARVVG